jgi:putative nucleotidyltransferase with HDIG domain
MDRPSHPSEHEESGAPATPERTGSFLVLRLRTFLRRGLDGALGADAYWNVLFVCVTTLLLGSQRCGLGEARFSVGQIAPYDITLRTETEMEDRALTEEKRREAAAVVPEVYVHDAARGERLVKELRRVFEEGRKVQDQAPRTGEAGPEDPVREALRRRVPEGALEILYRERFSRELEDRLSGVLAEAMQGLVVGTKALLEREPAVLLVHVPGDREERVSDYLAILDIDEVRRQVRDRVRSDLGLHADDAGPFGELVASFVDANVAYDPEGTTTRRQAASAAVPPVRVRMPKGTVLVRTGEKLTEETLARLDATGRHSVPRTGWVEIAGLLVVVSLLAFFLNRYSRYHQRSFRKFEHLHALLVLVLVSMIVLSQAMLWLAREITDNFSSPYNEVSSYTYLVPLGAGAILVALLANGRIAMVYSTFAAVLFGGLTGWDAYRLLWALLVQWIAIYAITTYRERAALLQAGLVVGGAGAAAAIAIEALRRTLEPLSHSLYGAGLAFLGGALGVGLVVSFSLPLLEGLFRVLTDIRLLELSNVNHPLLAELAVKAPGSYNHSLIVGRLAEEAAKAIGANSLFCRVAAFYHDIGKIRKPEYYVENQRAGNPHDRLSPSMSSLVISAHVKDGIRMAREAGLPEQIVDIIPQHHGTRLMSYFYEKARQSSDPSLGEIKEDDFRYPGPRPKTREAAIFMLADGVEAAARTIEEPTPSNLREMIKKIASAIVLDGQLDECDLTFSDLELIEDAFLRTLVSMYHHRLDYPGFDFNKRKGETKPPGGYRVVRGS